MRRFVVLYFLQVFQLFPSSLALFDGISNPSGNKDPIGSELGVAFELDEATVSVPIPGVPVRLWVEWRWWGLFALASWPELWWRGRRRCII